jgi:hypothetical protein
MPIVQKSAFDWKWVPDSDDVNADDSVALRLDNTIPDQLGARRLRYGSKTIYAGVGPVESLYTPILQDVTYRLVQSGDNLHVGSAPFLDDGSTPLLVEPHFDGSGDFSYGDDSYQCFIARGKTKKKWDSGRILEWGIAPPTQKATLSAVDSALYVISTFGSGVATVASASYNIAFSAANKTLTRTGGDFASDGFTAGSILKVSTTTSNNGTFKISTVATTVLTLVSTSVLTDETDTTTTLEVFGEYEGHGIASGISASNKDSVFIVNEGTGGYVENYALTKGAATSLVPNVGTGRASCHKKFTTGDGTTGVDTNLYDFAGSIAGDTDLFDMRVWFEDPRVVDKVTLMFGLGTGTDPFLDDYYYFDFQIRNNGVVGLKDPLSAEMDKIRNKRLSAPATPQEVTNVKSAAEARAIIRRSKRNIGPEYKERADSLAASPAWGHLAVTRGQFSRVGGTPGRDWKTVRAFKVVYTATPGSTKAFYLDDAVVVGGGDRALTGTFNVGFRFARRFFDNNGAEVYWELSPMSPISNDIVLQQQTLKVTIPKAAIDGCDPQAGSIWIYVFGGWLDTYYRFAMIDVDKTSMKTDDISDPNSLDEMYELARLTSWGFTGTTTQPDETLGLTVKIYKSEIEALTDNEVFEAGAVGPPDNIISMAGPWNKRVFCLTSEGWLYPSTQKSPSSFGLYQAIDLRMHGTPYWVAMCPSGIFVGCSKDIVMIAGSGDNDEYNITCDLYAVPLKSANPPVDGAVLVNENMIGYRSADGPMSFTGASSQPIPFAGTRMLWLGHDRHGVRGLNTKTGRFRFAVDNGIIYMLVPEGSENPTALWRYSDGQWQRFTYGSAALRCLRREPDGSLLAGTSTGVLELETGDMDSGQPISIDITTPNVDFGAPNARKTPVDVRIQALTGGAVGTLGLYLDRQLTPAKEIPFNTSIDGIYRASVMDMDKFTRLQAKITGAFNTFVLQGLGMSVNPRPNHVMALDFGWIIPDAGADIAYLTHIELDLESAYDLELDVYKNGVLHSTLPIVVTPNVRDIYTAVPPRDIKARRIGLKLRTTHAAGEGYLGFEFFMGRVRHGITGNISELTVTSGDIRSDQ